MKKNLAYSIASSVKKVIGKGAHQLHEPSFSKRELEVMENVRKVFNPEDLLNPGKGLPMKRGCAEAFHRHGGTTCPK